MEVRGKADAVNRIYALYSRYRVRTLFQHVFGVLPTRLHNRVFYASRWYRKHWGIGIRL